MREKREGRLLEKIRSHLQARYSYLTAKKPINWKSPIHFISFTFDDFPRSSYSSGGKTLEKYNLRATYYASLGLMGKTSSTGDIFILDDLRELMSKGNEIGCHTYDHCDSWVTKRGSFRESIIRNQEAINKYFPSYSFQSFSYPKTTPHPINKRIAGQYFRCCRGGGQTINRGTVDLNHLNSYFIDWRNRDNIEYFQEAIRINSVEKGWLIFSTHDIRKSPSSWGCNPEFFMDVLRYSVESKAEILPIIEVYKYRFTR